MSLALSAGTPPADGRPQFELEDHEVTVGEAYGTWTGLQASGVVPPAEEPASLQVTPTEGG